MHYLLIVKEADYPGEDELKHLLRGFMPARPDEKLGEYGVWKPWLYKNFDEFKAMENIEEDTLEEAIIGSEIYRIGDDNNVYEKVSIHCDSFNIFDIGTYADILEKYNNVGAFVENDKFYYTKALFGNRDCAFSSNELVYAIDCHN